MAQVTKDQIIERLKTVQDPELLRDIVSLNMVKKAAVCDGIVNVHIELTTPACPMKERLEHDVKDAISSLEGVKEVSIEWSAQVRGRRRGSDALSGVRNIVAVGAGKGGVGKSTAAVLLAVGLQREGARVGLLDADVYGPSIPVMLGLQTAQPLSREDKILPIEKHQIKIMSMGFLVDPDKAIIWRGPMVHGVVKQFLEQVDWGELDYLIVDLPPGTGDVPLTLAQSIPMTGAAVVCTPQDVALSDAVRAIKMYQQLNVPCLGIIENMSYYICPHCGHRDEIFSHGGAQESAGKLGVPFLGAIPLNARIRQSGDAGTPEICFTEAEDPVGSSVQAVVRNLAGQISIRNLADQPQPTLTIE